MLFGEFVLLECVIVYLNKKVVLDEIVDVFIIGEVRFFEVDFCFGFIVLVEIVFCVLFLLVNDYGIVINIISSIICFMLLWYKFKFEIEIENL